jgi:signal transduction histidine kinase/ligand-binding sensor domain-containing protein
MVKSCIILCCFLCLGFLASEAQLKHLIFDKYTAENGLSHSVCMCLAQDEDGFIWIGTEVGLNRFDGKDFLKIYQSGDHNQLPSNFITKIVCKLGHRLIVGTRQGLAVLNSETKIVQQLIIPSSDKLKQFTNDIQDVILDKKENLIVATTTGIYVLDADLKLTFRYDYFTIQDIGKKRMFFTYKSALHLLPDGRVIVMSMADSIYLLNVEAKKILNINALNNNEFNLFKKWNGLGKYVVGSNQAGRFYFIKYSPSIDSLFVIDFPTQKYSSSGLPPSISNHIDYASPIMFLNDQLLGITTFDLNGCFILKMDNKNPKNILVVKLLPETNCNDIIVDKNSRYWVSTSEGLFKESFSKSRFNNVLLPAFNNKFRDNDKYIYGFVHCKQRYFISQYLNGILIYDSSLRYIRTIPINIRGNAYLPWNIYYYSQDTLLLANQDGALLLNTDNYTIRPFWIQGMPSCIDSNMITACFFDSHHQLWLGIGSGNGVFKMDLRTREWKLFSPKTSKAEFKLRHPVSIFEDKFGNIWMGGAEGITRFNYKKQTFDTLISEMPEVGSISGPWNYFAMDSLDNLWVIEKNSLLVKFNIDTYKVTIFNLPGRPQLTGLVVKGPWNNTIWISTLQGLLAFDIINQKFTHIKKSDGLYEDQIEPSGRIYFDITTNRIFLGFKNAFTWFSPTEFLKERKPISIYITDIRKIGDSVSYPRGVPLTFPFEDNSFTIDYTSIDYDDGEYNMYAYRLFEKTPGPLVSVGFQKTATFIDLKPGNYNFQVKAVLSDGTENNSLSTIQIRILPPFYQTWWFYLLCFIVIISTFYSFYRSRINQILKMQAVRNRVAADLHDDIGSTLSSISIMSELAKVNSLDSLSLLNSIGESAAAIQENMSDLVWVVNPKNDHFNNIVQRMKQFSSEILGAKSIAFHLICDEDVYDERLSMDQRKKVYLFFKEAINNAAKYSCAKQVNVHISSLNDQIILTIEDNGNGFNLNNGNSGNGLANFRRRADELKGIFSIHSAINEGTKIQLSFKIT